MGKTSTCVRATTSGRIERPISSSGMWRLLKRLELDRLPSSQRRKSHQKRWQRHERPQPGYPSKSMSSSSPHRRSAQLSATTSSTGASATSASNRPRPGSSRKVEDHTATTKRVLPHSRRGVIDDTALQRPPPGVPGLATHEPGVLTSLRRDPFASARSLAGR